MDKVSMGEARRGEVFPGGEAPVLMLRAGCSPFTFFPIAISKCGEEARGNVSMMLVTPGSLSLPCALRMALQAKKERCFQQRNGKEITSFFPRFTPRRQLSGKQCQDLGDFTAGRFSLFSLLQ